MIARALFAMLTLVVFAGYKAAESQRAESFDGFALVDKAGNIQKPRSLPGAWDICCAGSKGKPNALHLRLSWCG
jgi:hypothetical protein